MPKPLPPSLAVPLLTRVRWQVGMWLSWPWTVYRLKRAGFRRTGWMTWESGPDDDL